MAWELPILDVPAAKAGVDFSTGQNGVNGTAQFTLVKLTGDDTYAPCTSVNDHPVGIAQGNAKGVGAAAQVRVLGVSKVVVGAGGLTAGQEYGTDANGNAIAITASTGSAFGVYVLGVCLEGGAQGAIATVTVGIGSRRI